VPLFEVTFGFTTDGSVVVTEYADGEWQAGATATDWLAPIRVGEAFDADGVTWMIGVDKAGNEVWRVSDISLSNDEGFRHAQAGDVSVMYERYRCAHHDRRAHRRTGRSIAGLDAELVLPELLRQRVPLGATLRWRYRRTRR